MSRRFLTRSSAVILACLCSIVTDSYACIETPIAEIVTPFWRGACVGEPVCFDGEGAWGSEEGSWDPDNGPPYSGGHGIGLYEWDVYYDCSVYLYTLYGPSPCYTFWDPGYYCLNLWVRDDEQDWCLPEDVDRCYVNVIEVEEVEKVGPEPNETGHVYTCLDGLLNLYARPNIEFQWPDGEVTWQIASSDPPGLTATLTPHHYKDAWAYLSDFSGAGHYVIEAKWGSYDPGDNTITVTVVEVDKLQYDDPDTGYTDIQFPLYVYIGTTVTFKAIPDPSGASWPTGKPIWGGSSGASGTGETTEVTFNTLSSSLSDYKTVTATCCNTITANIVVFDFEGVFKPKDDFDGRHTMYYGIEEEVELDFETDPWSVTAGQAGGLEWTKGSDSQPGTVSNVNIDYGTADYDAEETDGTVWLKLKIKSGPSKDEWEGYQKDVILPTGTRMTRVNPNTVWHIHGSASAGIALYYWLDPKYVSFKYLTFGEDSCPATGATGIYITVPPGNHPQNGPVGILGGNSTTGCRVEPEDHAGSGRNPWAPGGTYTWSIPTQYIDDTSTRNAFGSNQNQIPVLEANGDATMNKGGQSGSAALNDPTSGW